jgi:ribosomal protein S18 acetylase RimI-like enzyme
MEVSHMPSLFKSLEESALVGELILRDGGILQFHRSKKHPGVVTIYILLVMPEAQGQGVGTSMLDELKSRPDVEEIRATVEDGSPANQWYEHRGFTKVASRVAKSGKVLNIYRWTKSGEIPTVSPLRKARLAKGLTLQEVSNLTGISVSSLSFIERGQMPLLENDRKALEQALGEIEW